MQLSYGNNDSASTVVLLEANSSLEYAGAAAWSNTLQQIKALKPRVIVMPSKPQNWSDSEALKAIDQYGLMIGQPSVLEPSAEQEDLYSGMTLLPPADGKGYRQQWLRFKSEHGEYNSLELSVAQRIAGFELDSNQQRFYINFRDAVGRIPVIEIERVQTASLIETLLKDSIVLIGYSSSLAPRLSTPIGEIQFSMYQAYALDTLLNSKEINYPHLSVMMFLTLVIVVFLLILVPRITDQYQLTSFIVIVIFTLLSAWLALSFFNLWIQPGLLLIAEIMVFIALYIERYKQHAKLLRKMALKSASSVEHRWVPKNFYASEEHWTQIANMVSQTLSLSRTIFLERVNGEHRIREIKALNCSLDDINEMRRDYHRKPYTIAIEEGGVVRLNREYLVNPEVNEIQYLVPLNFAGEVLGFWALAIIEDKRFDEKKILYTIQQFSSQISEMLFHREQWLKHQQYQQKPWVKLLNLQFDEPGYASINHAMNFMAQRLLVMESVMDGMETSAVVYDLFGRVIQVNESMSATMSEIKLAPYSITAADLISQLTSCTLIEARNYLSYVILDKGVINLPVDHKDIKKGYMLSVRSLNTKGENITEEGDVRPFEITGILCELIDMSQISEIYSQKEKVIEHLSGWLRNDLSSISIACDLSKDKRIDEEKKSGLMDMIKNKVTSLGESVERVNVIMQSDFLTQVSAHYPVDCHKSLLSVINSAKKTQKKSVKFETNFPFYLPLVLASPNELKKIYKAIIQLLYSDVMEDGVIKISIIHKDKMIEFQFSNEGFGIPNEQLQEYLDNEDILESDEFKALRIIKHQVVEWGGNFEGSSSVGEGMRYTFNLQSFQAYE